MDTLNTLNARQREAAETLDGPVLILAGAGTGKTRTIIARIAHILEQGYAWPSQILAITFTNKAAREMNERLENFEGIDASGIWMSTFHVACARILRMYGERLGYTKNFKILDTDDQRTIVKRLLKEFNISDKDFSPAKVVGAISRLKNSERTPDGAEQVAGNHYEKQIAKIYRRYQHVLHESDSMDFDDLILNAVRLLRENGDILDYFQNKFKYILVDEFQDSATRSRVKSPGSC